MATFNEDKTMYTATLHELYRNSFSNKKIIALDTNPIKHLQNLVNQGVPFAECPACYLQLFIAVNILASDARGNLLSRESLPDQGRAVFLVHREQIPYYVLGYNLLVYQFLQTEISSQAHLNVQFQFIDTGYSVFFLKRTKWEP